MEDRNNIIPKISTSSWEDGVLTAHVTLRDMVATDVARILELDEVNTNISKLGKLAHDGPVECVLHVSAGVDSATGFSHYNQDKILKQDDSLLSEHVMPLMLVANEIRLWENPNPQSDTFCHAKSMRWMKEQDTITRKIFVDFYEEVHEIERRPIIIPAKVHGIDLSIRVSAFYAMVDGKAANAIVQNRDTHACPLCVKSADLRVGPAFFHSRLNAVEWLIRVTAQKHVPGHPAQAHPKVKEKAREIADRLEEKYKMNVNRPKIGGSGSSNNGNMARRLLADSESFASILGISKRLVEVIRLISCLALSSRKLDGKKIQELNAEMEALLKQEFPFVKRIPPCIHKYRHLPEIIERLVRSSYNSILLH